LSKLRALRIKGWRTIRYAQMGRLDLIPRELRSMWRVVNRKRYAARIMREDVAAYDRRP